MLDPYAEKATAISEYAIIVNTDDNVAVVKNETRDGLMLMLPAGDVVTVLKAHNKVVGLSSLSRVTNAFRAGFVA